jgi:hypothetical protein
MALGSVHSGLNDPEPSGVFNGSIVQMINMQAALSVLRDHPNFYNSVSYFACGFLILIWAALVLRKPSSREGAWLALAAIAVLSLLPVYHRPYDAKLLMLTIPACAMLWSQGGTRRWLALAFTAAGILATSDIPLAILVSYSRPLSNFPPTLAGRAIAMVQLRPVPLILLALGCFYLFVYARFKLPAHGLSQCTGTTSKTTKASAI